MSADDARAEAERRYPYGPVHTVGDYQQDVFRKVFVAGAEWQASRPLPSSMQNPLSEFVRDGVCLSCGGGVLLNGEHVEEDRHARYTSPKGELDAETVEYVLGGLWSWWEEYGNVGDQVMLESFTEWLKSKAPANGASEPDDEGSDHA